MCLFKKYSIFLLFFYVSCTSNPFWDDPKSTESTITGKIALSSFNKNIPLLIWDQNFNILTKTDSSGYFSIPLTSFTDDVQKFSGLLKIYFFALNYGVDSANIFLRNGFLSDNQTDFDKNGSLIKNIILIKLIEGHLSITNPEMNYDQSDTLLVSFRLKALDFVDVKTYKYIHNSFECSSGLFFKSLENNNIIKFNHFGFDQNENLINDQIKYIQYDRNEVSLWNYYISKTDLNLESGRYLIVPYLKINKNTFPIENIEIIDSNYSFFFSDDYLNIPSDFILDTLIIR